MKLSPSFLKISGRYLRREPYGYKKRFERMARIFLPYQTDGVGILFFLFFENDAFHLFLSAYGLCGLFEKFVFPVDGLAAEFSGGA